jgi:hypothetical protein
MHSSSPDLSTLLRAMLVAGVLCLGTSVSVTAQPTVSLRGNVGASFFQAPEGVSRALHSGASLGVGGGVRVWRGLSVTVHGGYDQFSLNKENLRTFVDGTTWGKVSYYSASLGLRYTYLNESDAHPYLDLGIGVYQLTVSNQKTVQGDQLVDEGGRATDTQLGSHLALGSLLRLNDTYALFFESRYDFYNVGDRLAGTQRYFTLRLGMDVQF